jgi:hypothetical protein
MGYTEMGYIVTGFVGVLLGAAVALTAVLLLLQKGVDRDLIERRLDALLDYREWLGEPDRLLNGNGNLDSAVVAQLLANLEALARRFRRTAWLFDDPLRSELGAAVHQVERALERLHRRSGQDSAEELGGLLNSCQALDSELRIAVSRTVKSHRRIRFLPSIGTRKA